MGANKHFYQNDTCLSHMNFLKGDISLHANRNTVITVSNNSTGNYFDNWNLQSNLSKIETKGTFHYIYNIMCRIAYQRILFYTVYACLCHFYLYLSIPYTKIYSNNPFNFANQLYCCHYML